MTLTQIIEKLNNETMIGTIQGIFKKYDSNCPIYIAIPQNKHCQNIIYFIVDTNLITTQKMLTLTVEICNAIGCNAIEDQVAIRNKKMFEDGFIDESYIDFTLFSKDTFNKVSTFLMKNYLNKDPSTTTDFFSKKKLYRKRKDHSAEDLCQELVDHLEKNNKELFHKLLVSPERTTVLKHFDEALAKRTQIQHEPK